MRINKLSLAMFATAAGLGLSGAADAAAFMNGGFEDPVLTPSGAYYQQIDGSSTFITGWTVPAGNSVDLVNNNNGNFPAFEGTQLLDLVGGGSTGSISQTFDTVAGKSYRLSFAYSHNHQNTPSASASVSVGTIMDSVTHSTPFNGSLNWQTYQGIFVAGAGTSSTLTFVNTAGGGNGGLLLDDVSVAAVPEPATWAMMIAGFGLVGGLARRRRRVAAFA